MHRTVMSRRSAPSATKAGPGAPTAPACSAPTSVMSAMWSTMAQSCASLASTSTRSARMAASACRARTPTATRQGVQQLSSEPKLVFFNGSPEAPGGCLQHASSTLKLQQPVIYSAKPPPARSAPKTPLCAPTAPCLSCRTASARRMPALTAAATQTRLAKCAHR